MNTKRVLVVDNEKSVLDTFRLLLEDLGFEPVLINNFQDAVHVIKESQNQKNPFRAAIIDYQLNSGHTGLEIFEYIMESDENLARRSIIITARHHTDALALFSHTKIKPGLFLYKDYDDNKKIEDFLGRP
jgi:DNA-binding NtrC family response regulator